MASNNTINTRIQHKHDVESNWNKAENFIPLIGEIIVYDIDSNFTYERFKIGDGKTVISKLPFCLENEIDGVVSDIQTQLNNKSQVQIITWEADD